MREEAESLRHAAEKLNEELGRSGAESLEAGRLSLEVAQLEAGLRRASRREDANNVISELIQAAKENETNLET